jgi:2-oxoglutarate ferredoxin oxidoreductase subunit alpha
MEGAEVGIIAYGSTDPAVLEARDRLALEDLPTDYLRLRALPVGEEVVSFIKGHQRVYVIEMNRDGQLHQILAPEFPDCTASLISLTHNDGLALTAAWVQDAIKTAEGA